MKTITKKRIPWNKGLKGAQVAWNKGLPKIAGAGKDFIKGQKPWNKNTKGLTKPNKTSFIKGQIPYNKGTVGDTGTYSGVHKWVKQKLGQPNYCEHCKKSDKIIYEWANKEHNYKRVIKDWMRLCRGCHMKYDYKFNKRVKRK